MVVMVVLVLVCAHYVKTPFFFFIPFTVGVLIEIARIADLHFELSLRTHLEHVRTACTGIYHLEELAHDNAHLKEARPMLDVQDET